MLIPIYNCVDNDENPTVNHKTNMECINNNKSRFAAPSASVTPFLVGVFFTFAKNLKIGYEFIIPLIIIVILKHNKFLYNC